MVQMRNLTGASILALETAQLRGRPLSSCDRFGLNYEIFFYRLVWDNND